MARFIVAYDGSAPSRASFDCALALAARTRERAPSPWSLLLLHVIEPTPDVLLAESPAVALDPMMPPHMPMGLPTTLIEAERRQRAWVEQEASGLRRECEAVSVMFDARVEVGSLLDVLEDAAAADDVIAVGATGRFRRGGVGSTTKALVRNAACPVLVVHERTAGTAPGETAALACPFDGTPQAHDALNAARRMSKDTGIPLNVLAVARAGSSATSRDAAALASTAQVAAPGATVVPLAAGSGAESELVARYVREHPGTLLVMGAYADSWIHELFVGSTTAQVLTALTGPVLLVHDQKRDHAAHR